jgi:CheY-like chemotaxis protein
MAEDGRGECVEMTTRGVVVFLRRPGLHAAGLGIDLHGSILAQGKDHPGFALLFMLASKKILIADDDRGSGVALTTRLRGLGCEVGLVATSLEEACERAVRELPSVVILSLSLVDGARGGLGGVRDRFAMAVVFVAPVASAGPALGLEVWEYVVRGGSDRELQLVLAGAWARMDAETRFQEIEAQMKKEQAFGDLGRVAANVAHKFNNLLMAVTSASSLMRMDMPAGSPLGVQLDKLDDVVTRAAELCRHLLDGVRRENGTLLHGEPAAETFSPAIPAAKAGRSGIHGSVLIVDDDESVRALARWVVERAGYPAVAARDGDEALEKFRADPGAYGLVLLDLTMPRMSGEEVLVGLRSIRPNVQVVVITGYGEEAVRESERAGIVGFLQKPFSPDALRAMLQRCAGK